MFPGYRAQWFHIVLASYLEAVERGEIDRLIVTFPPRHGKSQLASVSFPSWFLGRNPDKRIIGTSYAAHLARRFSGQARNRFLDQRWPFPVSLSLDTQSKESWDLDSHRGGYISAGVGGPITGQGAHVAIIDDPIKNAEEAESELIRDGVWDWYTSTLYTRLEEQGAIILIQTRWHADDLAGRLLRTAAEDPDADQWVVLNLPAIAEHDEPWGRKIGDALWPDKYSVRDLNRIRRNIGSRHFEALYQQNPTATEGGILKRAWWKYWAVKPEPFDKIIQSWDMTFKDTKGSDYVVGQVWGTKGADAYLLDQTRAQLDFPATVNAVKALCAKWETKEKLVEDKANGPAVISTLKSEIPGLVAVEPEGGKQARAAAVSWYIEGGNVYLPDPKLHSWVREFVDECSAFPRGAHDDQVDAMSQALARIAAANRKGVYAAPVGLGGTNKWR